MLSYFFLATFFAVFFALFFTAFFATTFFAAFFPTTFAFTSFRAPRSRACSICRLISAFRSSRLSDVAVFRSLSNLFSLFFDIPRIFSANFYLFNNCFT